MTPRPKPICHECRRILHTHIEECQGSCIECNFERIAKKLRGEKPEAIIEMRRAA